MQMFLFLATASSLATQPNPNAMVDYPETAVKEGRHGSTVIAFDVLASGKVANCKILRSSGSADLDAASCNLISDRARYEPAVDSAGSPKTVSTGITIHWIMPGQRQTAADLPIGKSDLRILHASTDAGPHTGSARATAPRRLAISDAAKYPKKAMDDGEQGRVDTVVDVDRKGKPVKCTVIRTSGYERLDRATCKFALSKLRFEPATDHDGKPTTGRELFYVDWRL